MKDFIKVTLKWLSGVIVYVVMLALTGWWMPWIVSLFTRPMDPDLPKYTWGSLWGTFDNPPQGDRAYIAKHSPFPNVITGWKGYVNRSMWITRNSLYNLKLKFLVRYKDCTNVVIEGNAGISDKYKVPGWLFAKAYCGDKLIAWEWYSITPYSETRNIRIRLGWKIKGDKFDETGEYAQLVFTINPFDGYGKK